MNIQIVALEIIPEMKDLQGCIKPNLNNSS